jgi:hypothetical protein
MKMSKKFVTKVLLLAILCSVSFTHKTEARKIVSQQGYMSNGGCCFTIVTTYSYNLFGIELWTSQSSDTQCEPGCGD